MALQELTNATKTKIRSKLKKHKKVHKLKAVTPLKAFSAKSMVKRAGKRGHKNIFVPHIFSRRKNAPGHEDGTKPPVAARTVTTITTEANELVTSYSPLVDWEDSTFVITGGRNEFMINLNTVEKLELESSCVLTPKTIKRMPFAIYDHMSFYVTDKFVFCGGHKRPAVVSNQCFGLRNVPGANWTELPNIPELIFDAADTTIGNTAFIIGGFIKAPSDTVFSFNGETEEWKREPSLSRGRFASCAVSFGDTIYVIGEREKEPRRITFIFCRRTNFP